MPPESKPQLTLGRRAAAWIGNQHPLVLVSMAFFAVVGVLGFLSAILSAAWVDSLRAYFATNLAPLTLLSLSFLGMLVALLARHVTRPSLPGMSATFIDARADGASAVYRQATEWVRLARKEVRVLQCWTSTDRPIGGSMESAAEYYEALLELPRRGVRYTHLIQSVDASSWAQGLKDPLLTSHLEHVLMRRAAGGDDAIIHVRLKHTLPTIAETLAFIDDHRLIWHLHERTGDGADLLSGMMFVDDPGGQLVPAVRRRYERLEGQASPVTMRPGRAPRPPGEDGRGEQHEGVVLDWRRPS